MNNSKHPYEILEGISLYDIKTFLKSHGWKKIIHPNNKWVVFQGPRGDSGNPLEIFLPKSEKFEDCWRRIFDAFNFLSNFYEINPAKLSDTLKGLNKDNFIVRIIETENNAFSIPLELAQREVNGMRDLIVYSACSEKNALPHYDQPLSIGRKMSEKIRFGHTFKGSFGFTVEVPIIGEFKQQDIWDVPIERKILERIVRGFLFTEQAVSESDPEIIVRNYRHGFNSRMCEAIVEIGEVISSPVEVSVSWASNLIPSEDVSDFKPKVLGENEISFLKYAADKLKEVSPQKTLITGRVVNLHSNDPISEDGKRTIVLKYLHEDFGTIDVKIELGIEQYRAAIDAHKSREMIEINGLLERKGSVWYLHAASDLKTLKSI